MEGLGHQHPEPGDEIVTAMVVENDLLTIGVDGRAGQDGRDGQSYAGSRAPRGHDGRPGQHATRAEPGQAAGHLELALRPAGPHEQRVDLLGRRVLADGRERPVQERVVFGELGSIRLTARGGTGGSGGRGGDGEAGGKGRDGRDATRYAAGGDGERGGDGGAGGDGTSGGNGGNGGRITVEVDQRDTHLLMLVQAEVDGGAGGAAGTNGQGGEGGPGGDGGRSYRWTTTSTEYHTDSQGRRQPRMVTYHHRNRGGSDGPRGRRGRDGQGILSHGADGAPGDFRILVRQAGRIAEYRERYEVDIVAYDVELADSFAEPTSSIRVARLTVRNSGGMPTPERCPVEVVLAASRWTQPRRQTLVLPRALEPGETYTFADEVLLADVPDTETVPEGEPLREPDRVTPLARQSGVQRWYSNRHPRQEFTVAFPAELDPVQSLESQAPGRAATVVLGVTNRARVALGSQSESRRILAVRVELRNQPVGRHLMLLDMEGNAIPWARGYREEIGELPAGAGWSRQLILGVLPGAPGYEQVELAMTLELGQRDVPGTPRDRHCRPYPIRIARAYQYNPEADILLVTNHATTPEEVTAWREAAARLGQTISLWDISLNDSLSLSERLAHGQNLLRDFHGKTIVLSNAPFQTSLGTRYGDQFLSQMDLIKAAASHAIRVLVVNDAQRDVSHLFQQRLIPTDGEPEYRYDSIRAFEKAEPLDDVDLLFEQVDELIRHGTRAARPNPVRQTSEIDIYGIRSPKQRRLRKQAIKLQRRLQNNSPGRRVVVSYRLPADLSEQERRDRERRKPHEGLFFTHDHQGTLTVMPTLGDNHPNVILLDAPAQRIHDPEFILGQDVAAALVQSLSFEEKVYLLSARLRELGATWRADRKLLAPADIEATRFLVDALLVDLATEQQAVLKTGWIGLFSGRRVREALRQLRFLAEHPFTLVTGGADQPDVQLAARLIAGLQLLGETSSRWYESRWFPWGWFRRGPLLRQTILAHRDALSSNLIGRANTEQSQLIEAQLAKYRAAVKQARRETKADPRTAARQVLFSPLSRFEIRTDAGAAFTSVLSDSEWRAIQQAEAERERSRVALHEAKEANRAAHAVARDGRPLPRVDAATERALQPFVDACAAANTELQERVRQAVPKRPRAPLEPLPLAESRAEQETEAGRTQLGHESEMG